MMRYIHYFAVFALFLAACGGAGGRAGYTAQQQTVDGVTIKLEQPQQIAVLQNFELFATITDAAGQPIDGATVYMEQDMPGMKMGSNQPLGEPLGNGQYRLAGVFTMDGEWHLVINVSAAGKSYAATFQQQVKLSS